MNIEQVEILMRLMGEHGVTELRMDDVHLMKPTTPRPKTAAETMVELEREKREQAAVSDRYNEGFENWKRGGGIAPGGGR